MYARKSERGGGGQIVNKKAIVLLSGIRPRGARGMGGAEQPSEKGGPTDCPERMVAASRPPLFERYLCARACAHR